MGTPAGNQDGRATRLAGPTQTAEHGASNEWAPRPRTAKAIRIFITAFPYLVGFLAAIALTRYLPPETVGLHPILWWVGVAAVSSVSMIPADRVVRRLMPMTSLLTVALGFPDAAPSRFKVALRATTAKKVRLRVDEALAEARTEANLDRINTCSTSWRF